MRFSIIGAIIVALAIYASGALRGYVRLFACDAYYSSGVTRQICRLGADLP